MQRIDLNKNLTGYAQQYMALCAANLSGLGPSEKNLDACENDPDPKRSGAFRDLDMCLRENLFNLKLYQFDGESPPVIVGRFPLPFFLNDVREALPALAKTVKSISGIDVDENTKINPPPAEILINIFINIAIFFPEKLNEPGINLMEFCCGMIVATVQHQPENWINQARLYREFAELLKKKENLELYREYYKNLADNISAKKNPDKQKQGLVQPKIIAPPSNENQKQIEKYETPRQFTDRVFPKLPSDPIELLNILNSIMDRVPRSNKDKYVGVSRPGVQELDIEDAYTKFNLFNIALLTTACITGDSVYASRAVVSKAILNDNLDLELEIPFTKKYDLIKFLRFWLEVNITQGSYNRILSPVKFFDIFRSTNPSLKIFAKYILKVTMDAKVIELLSNIDYGYAFFTTAYLHGNTHSGASMNFNSPTYDIHALSIYGDNPLTPREFKIRLSSKLESLGWKMPNPNAVNVENDFSIEDLITLYVSWELSRAETGKYRSGPLDAFIEFKIRTKELTNERDNRYPRIQFNIPDASTFEKIRRFLVESGLLSSSYDLCVYKGPNRKYEFLLKRSDEIVEKLTDHYKKIKSDLPFYIRTLKNRDDSYQRLLQRLNYVATLKLNDPARMDKLDHQLINQGPENSPWQLIADFIGMELKLNLGKVGGCGRFDESHVYMTFPDATTEEMSDLYKSFPPEDDFFNNTISNKTIVINNEQFYSAMKKFFDVVIRQKMEANQEFELFYYGIDAKNQIQLKRMCFLLGLSEVEIKRDASVFLQLLMAFFKFNVKLDNATFETWRDDKEFTALSLNITETTVLVKLLTELRKFAESNFCGTGSDLAFLVSNADGSLQLCVHTRLLFNKVLDHMEKILPLLHHYSKLTVNKNDFINPPLCDASNVAAAFSASLGISNVNRDNLQAVANQLELFSRVAMNTLFERIDMHANQNCMVLRLRKYSNDQKYHGITQKAAIAYITSQVPNLIIGVVRDDEKNVIGYLINNSVLVNDFLPARAKQLPDPTLAQRNQPNDLVNFFKSRLSTILNILNPDAVMCSHGNPVVTAMFELAGVKSDNIAVKIEQYGSSQILFNFKNISEEAFAQVCYYYQQQFPELKLIKIKQPDPQIRCLAVDLNGFMNQKLVSKLREMPNRYMHDRIVLPELARKLQVDISVIKYTCLVATALVQQIEIHGVNQETAHFGPLNSDETYFSLNLLEDDITRFDITRFIVFWNRLVPDLKAHRGVGEHKNDIIMNTRAFFENVVPILRYPENGVNLVQRNKPDISSSAQAPKEQSEIYSNYEVAKQFSKALDVPMAQVWSDEPSATAAENAILEFANETGNQIGAKFRQHGDTETKFLLHITPEVMKRVCRFYADRFPTLNVRIESLEFFDGKKYPFLIMNTRELVEKVIPRLSELRHRHTHDRRTGAGLFFGANNAGTNNTNNSDDAQMQQLKNQR